MKEIEQVARDYRLRGASGLSLDAMLDELYQRGLSLVETIKVIRLTEDVSLAAAHRAVTSNSAWRATPRVADFVIGLLESVHMDVLALQLSGELGLEFRMRESAYYGGLYFTTRQPQQPVGTEEVYVFANRAPLGGPEYPVEDHREARPVWS